MHITNDIINKEIRLRGIVINKLLSFFTTKAFKRCNNMLDLFMKGRCRSNINYEQKWILRPDGSKLRICIYSSKNPKENVPGLLWIHEGGYAIGIPEQDESYIKRFINAIIV
jgi:hypothetical protein